MQILTQENTEIKALPARWVESWLWMRTRHTRFNCPFCDHNSKIIDDATRPCFQTKNESTFNCPVCKMTLLLEELPNSELRQDPMRDYGHRYAKEITVESCMMN